MIQDSYELAACERKGEAFPGFSSKGLLLADFPKRTEVVCRQEAVVCAPRRYMDPVTAAALSSVSRLESR